MALQFPMGGRGPSPLAQALQGAGGMMKTKEERINEGLFRYGNDLSMDFEQTHGEISQGLETNAAGDLWFNEGASRRGDINKEWNTYNKIAGGKGDFKQFKQLWDQMQLKNDAAKVSSINLYIDKAKGQGVSQANVLAHLDSPAIREFKQRIAVSNPELAQTLQWTAPQPGFLKRLFTDTNPETLDREANLSAAGTAVAGTSLAGGYAWDRFYNKPLKAEMAKIEADLKQKKTTHKGKVTKGATQLAENKGGRLYHAKQKRDLMLNIKEYDNKINTLKAKRKIADGRTAAGKKVTVNIKRLEAQKQVLVDNYSASEKRYSESKKYYKKGVEKQVKLGKPPRGKSAKNILKEAKKTAFGEPGAIRRGLAGRASYFGGEIGSALGGAIGDEEGAFAGRAVGSMPFLAFVAKRIPTVGAKIFAKAGARHAGMAATGIGAHPLAQAGGLLLDVGLAAGEIYKLYEEWQKLNK